MANGIKSQTMETRPKPFRSSFGKGLRAVSAILVVTFLWQDILHAEGAAPSWAHVAQVKTQTVDKSESKFNSITIPSDSGVARKAVAQGAGDVIINIQDAHAKLGAQESIAKILDNLVKNYSLSL